MSGIRETGGGAGEATRRARQDGWTGERRRRFVETLGKAGNVRDACRAAGLSSTSAYRLRRREPGFAADWDAALKRAATSLEAVAYRRAVEGVEEPVIQGGRQVGTRVRYSDALLRLLMQGADPERYGRTGRQPSVQAREAVEARVREIEEAAYRRAWACFSAEYRYQLEPVYYGQYLIRKLAIMNRRMCKDPRCAECHPRRDPPLPGFPHAHPPGPDHETIAPHQWQDRTEEEIARARAEEPDDADLWPENRAPETKRWEEELCNQFHAERREVLIATGQDVEQGPWPDLSDEPMPCPVDRLLAGAYGDADAADGGPAA